MTVFVLVHEVWIHECCYSMFYMKLCRRTRLVTRDVTIITHSDTCIMCRKKREIKMQCIMTSVGVMNLGLEKNWTRRKCSQGNQGGVTHLIT